MMDFRDNYKREKVLENMMKKEGKNE